MARNFLLELDEAQKHLKTADHMIYVTFPIIREKRLLIKILEEIYNSTLKIVNAVLQYEYMMKRIKLYNDDKLNFEVFRQKCAQRYNIQPEQIENIRSILKLVEQHKQSPLEFARRDKFIIMSDTMHFETINIEKLKSFLFTVKDIAMKVGASINKY